MWRKGRRHTGIVARAEPEREDGRQLPTAGHECQLRWFNEHHRPQQLHSVDLPAAYHRRSLSVRTRPLLVTGLLARATTQASSALFRPAAVRGCADGRGPGREALCGPGTRGTRFTSDRHPGIRMDARPRARRSFHGTTV